MALIMNLGDDTDIKWLYNVSYPVGPYCPNHRDDVLLVQYTINCLLAALQLTDSDGQPITTYLKRDGLYGDHTEEAIFAYQRNVSSRGFFITVDGRVDPSPVSGWTPHGNAQYTIVYLNRDYLNTYGTMMQEQDMPLELQHALDRNSKV